MGKFTDDLFDCLICRMAIIDGGGEDEVDKMMGQLKVFDNNPLPRYYSEQLDLRCYIVKLRIQGYGFLINFSLIMLDSPWLLFSLSTWFFFVLDGLRGSS